MIIQTRHRHPPSSNPALAPKNQLAFTKSTGRLLAGRLNLHFPGRVSRALLTAPASEMDKAAGAGKGYGIDPIARF